MSFSPRQADVLICAGRLPFKLAPVIRRIWDQMPQPKWSISMGACASTGGIFDTYTMVQGIDTIIPVDVYVPGCPPRPEGLIYGILLLQKKIKGESITDDRLRVEQLVGRRALPAAGAGGRALRAVRQLGPPDEQIGVSPSARRTAATGRLAFVAGPPPRPRRVPAAMRPSSCGETIVYVARSARRPRLAQGHAGPGIQLPHRRHRGGVPRPGAPAGGGLPAPLARPPGRPPGQDRARQGGAARGRSVVDLWRGADWLEREVFDMFGVGLRRPSRSAPDPDVGDLRRGATRCGRISRCAGTSAGRSRPGRRSPPIPRPTIPWKSCPSPRPSTSCPRTCGAAREGRAGYVK